MIHFCGCGKSLRCGAFERGIQQCRECRRAGKGLTNWWRVTEIRLLRSISDQPRLEIAARLGRSERSVIAAAKRNGIALTGLPRNQWPEGTVRRCRAMHAAGVLVRAISERTGVPYHTLRSWFYDGYREAA